MQPVNSLICTCGEPIQLSLVQNGMSQENDRWVGFCPKCHKRWKIEDTTYEYEEMVVNGIDKPENGEYEKDGLWHYSDGTCME